MIGTIIILLLIAAIAYTLNYVISKRERKPVASTPKPEAHPDIPPDVVAIVRARGLLFDLSRPLDAETISLIRAMRDS